VPAPPQARPTLAHWFAYGLWFIILCDPQWWLSVRAGSAILQVPTALFAVFLLMTLAKLPRELFPALLVFFLYTALTLPLAWNPLYALTPTKQLLLYYVLTLGTLAFVKSYRQAAPLLLLVFVLQFLWWGAFGARTGNVRWHPTNSNFDGYGPQVVLGLATCYYFFMAARPRVLKTLAVIAGVLAIVGVVASFARGAAVSAAAVLFWVWFRSPKKGKGTIMLAGAALVVLAAGSLIIKKGRTPEGDITQRSLWSELATIGVGEDATEDDRFVLWSIANKVFLRRPLIGVGAENTGPYAAENFEAGTLGGNYNANPGRLYDRDMHSTFFQVLAEYGIIGTALFGWVLVDFWRRNRRLRSRQYVETWAAMSGGTLDLRNLALGLEACMVAFLCTAFFYNQLFVPWLYFILGMNVLLHRIARPPRAPLLANPRALRR
jgi:O-antigen ligase